MKVLWLSNQMPPMAAQILGREAGNKEGWLTGLLEQVVRHGGPSSDDTADTEKKDLELGICFPVAADSGPVRGKTEDFSYFGFYEDTVHCERYDSALESQLADILREFQPDIVHCFGTEYPHTLAMSRVCGENTKLLIGIQGLCSRIADAYMADLPENIQKRYLPRDLLKRDNLMRQQRKFARRGQFETEALRNAAHVTGRTDWDREAAARINPKAEYHFMNETLRPEFYDGRWSLENCEKHTVFLSQGNYPLKGLHYLLWALPEILERYPDTRVYVAGDQITRYRTLKEKLKIGSYGKYCLDLMRQYKITEKVCFLGRMSGVRMKERYLRSHVFLSPSALENSPNSVCEAMILGMPVISSAVGGVPSLLRDGEEGILYTRGDTSALAAAVIRIFDEDDRAVALGSRARERALRVHDPETNYRRLLEIYGEIV